MLDGAQVKAGPTPTTRRGPGEVEAVREVARPAVEMDCNCEIYGGRGRLPCGSVLRTS